MRRSVCGVLVAAALASAATARPAAAHHSFAAAFDADKPVTVQGVIVDARLANPHSWIYLDVTDASGAVTRWGFEAQTPTALIRSGVKPEVFKVGSRVTIHGVRARDATKNEGAARDIVLADGRSYIIGPKGNDPDRDK
jgi:hypothetical protein